MNVKAERMEQMIQVVNRNLQLVFSGEPEGITPLEVRELEKVDAVVFGHDKFAFEMVHFLKSSLGKNSDRPGSGSKGTNNQKIEDLWETNFVQGLESLLVECAVINDDIERDCFVSRVYCWFTEKLQERRDLPRKNARVENLRASIERLGGDQTHTLRGLDAYEKSLEQMSYQDKLNASHGQVRADPNDRDLPTISVPDKKSRFGSRHVPAYVKQGFPNVLSSAPPPDNFGRGTITPGGEGLFPKIPGADENYGMLHNVPETAAEKAMHEMWMARRRQEAFEWKTQQHLALVMDRLALHKSRLESDALRRQESSTMLKTKGRPATADALHRADAPPGRRGDKNSSNLSRSTTAAVTGRPAARMFRPAADSPSPSRNKARKGSPDRSPARHSAAEQGQQAAVAAAGAGVGKNMTVVVAGKGSEMEANIMSPGRTTVVKATPSKLPMRFKTQLPDDYSEHQKFYMQLSDSDDDDVPERATKALRRTVVATGKGGAAKKGAGAKPEVAFKHDRPVDRERPVSARMLHTVSANDSEFKVHYRHTNYRRMPLTEAQEQWLDERESMRVKKSEEMATQLVENAAKKADKKGAKGGKDEKKDGKDKGGKGAKKAVAAKPEEVKVKSKYASAVHAMTALFPNFEDESDPATLGPMRAMQLVELGTILGAFQDADVPIKESVLRKALLIPQDRPEAICLEGLREEKEGLMVNPLPKELWRKAVVGSKKSGGKKGKKKKG